MILNELMTQKLKEEMKKESSFFLVVKKTPLDKVEEIKGPHAPLIQFIYRFKIRVSYLSRLIISSGPFEAISMAVIVANSVSLAIEDPTK